MKPNHRAIIAGLQKLGSVTVRGQVYSGAYFAVQLAINWELAGHEAERTPKLIFELGRIVAAARRDKDKLEANYRIWREKLVWEFAIGPAAPANAEKAGFQSMVNPGVDAKGKEKPAKTPSKADVESYMRTLPTYLEFQEAIQVAEEAWQVCYSAYEGAKARQWVIKGWDPSTMGVDRAREYNDPEDNPAAEPTDWNDDLEASVANLPREPLAPPPSTVPGPPAAAPDTGLGTPPPVEEAAAAEAVALPLPPPPPAPPAPSTSSAPGA